MNKKIKCYLCHDKGTIPESKFYYGYGESRQKFCTCSRGKKQFANWKKKLAAQRKVNLKNSGKPLSDSSNFIKDKTLDDLANRPDLQSACKDYLKSWHEVKDYGFGLYFHGEKGSGKTFTASVLCRELRLKKVTETLFLNVPKLEDKFSYNLSLTGRKKALERLKSVDLLVLDDLGNEKVSATFTGFLYQAIDYRWRHRKPVIVTSRRSLEEISWMYPSHVGYCLSGRTKPVEC